MENIYKTYSQIRKQTISLCEPLEIEDFVVQPMFDTSPLKWHLGHTTWFFENFVLKVYYKNYKIFHEKYGVLFNSYYIAAGDRWERIKRGTLTRPTVKEIFEYRAYVDKWMGELLNALHPKNTDLLPTIMLGLNHERQHQELFLYDVKNILGNNPLYPSYRPIKNPIPKQQLQRQWLKIEEGIYQIGYENDDFHFDNEKGVHKVFLHHFQIHNQLITNKEYIEFIDDNGYNSFQLWLSDGWDWLQSEQIKNPLYWIKKEDGWWHYTLGGIQKIDLDDPVCHISFYEADAFARWKGARLPTEFEWEIACKTYESKKSIEKANFLENQYFKPIQSGQYDFLGNVWEWTSSPYSPYPYFKILNGALGEYNGKFMINQMVLRGGSFATSKNHIRITFRNFFHPHLRWLFSGIRLAKHI